VPEHRRSASSPSDDAGRPVSPRRARRRPSVDTAHLQSNVRDGRPLEPQPNLTDPGQFSRRVQDELDTRHRLNTLVNAPNPSVIDDEPAATIQVQLGAQHARNGVHVQVTAVDLHRAGVVELAAVQALCVRLVRPQHEPVILIHRVIDHRFDYASLSWDYPSAVHQPSRSIVPEPDHSRYGRPQADVCPSPASEISGQPN
jgi:hypothetical protein